MTVKSTRPWMLTYTSALDRIEQRIAVARRYVSKEIEDIAGAETELHNIEDTARVARETMWPIEGVTPCG